MSDSIPPAYRVVMVGDSMVGKTCLLANLCGEAFDERPRPTVGAAWVAYAHEFRNQRISLQIWDTAGQEMYRSLGPLYYRGATGAMIVYDVSNPASFRAVGRWANELLAVAGTDAVVFVIANKSDLPREVPDTEGIDFAQEQGYEWFATSALTGNGVQEAFTALAERIAAGKLVTVQDAEIPTATGRSCC
jgi:small GTP-binding protein